MLYESNSPKLVKILIGSINILPYIEKDPILKFAVHNPKTQDFVIDLFIKKLKLNPKYVPIVVDQTCVSYKTETIKMKPTGACSKMVLMCINKNNSSEKGNYNNELNYYIPKNENNRLKLNIIYYDENLLDNMNLNEYCSYIQMNIGGTFYGCHNMDLLNLICDKVNKFDREFILISSGSAFEKVYKKVININNIREYYIYCCNKERYLPLKQKYFKLKEVFNDSKELNNKLNSIIPTKINEGIKSSNLIYFEDYIKIYIKLHFEIIRKYSLYKILKKYNYNEKKFLEKVESSFPKFLSVARQLFPDTNEIIEFFHKKIGGDKDTIAKVFYNNENAIDFIKNYTKESFYFKYLNLFLRTGDFNSFRILSSHLSKIFYDLYEYREKNMQIISNLTLYRKMNISEKEFNDYKNSIGRVICYPSFTSTSSDKNGFIIDYNVLLVINSNNSKSVISIGKHSVYESEKEYLFLPFSFFKINDIKVGQGTQFNPHIVYLVAMNSDSPIEEIFSYFFQDFSDSLDPEGLDILQINLKQNKIYFNSDYYKK